MLIQVGPDGMYLYNTQYGNEPEDEDDDSDNEDMDDDDDDEEDDNDGYM